jgi:hypothetical protein
MGVQEKEEREISSLCALGYTQIPGKDFIETSSPVVDDMTVRAVIVHMIANGWDSKVIDVTTAFLHEQMEDEVYMKCPDGIEFIEDGWDRIVDCTELLQTIYGTKQAARQY